MDNLPLVSIRIACYNHENFVQKTLDSVLKNKYDNKELVIIDDCSTDDSWNKIKEWAKSNKDKIKIIYKKNNKNLGVSKTVNKLHKLCSGEFVVGIASDDELTEWSIQKRVDYLLSNPRKKVVFGDCLVINEKDQILYDSGLSGLYNINKLNLIDDDTMKTELILNWGVPGGTIMMRKEILNEIPFNEKLIVEDFDLFLKWMSKNYLGFLDEKISIYRVHSSNTSGCKSLQTRRYLDFIRTIFCNLQYYNIKYKVILFYAILKRVIKAF